MGGIVVSQTDVRVDHWAVCWSFRKSASLAIHYSDVPDKDSSRHNVVQRKTGWQMVLENQEDVWFHVWTLSQAVTKLPPLCKSGCKLMCWLAVTYERHEGTSWIIRDIDGFVCFRIGMVLDNHSGGFWCKSFHATSDGTKWYFFGGNSASCIRVSILACQVDWYVE